MTDPNFDKEVMKELQMLKLLSNDKLSDYLDNLSDSIDNLNYQGRMTNAEATQFKKMISEKLIGEIN